MFFSPKFQNKIQLFFMSIVYAVPTLTNQDSDKLNLAIESPELVGATTITPQSIITGAIGMVLLVSIVVFFFILVTGGIKWITSAGDEKKLTTARAQITNGLVGLIIIFSSWAILRLIGTLFNINILNELTLPSFNNQASQNNHLPIYQTQINQTQ